MRGKHRPAMAAAALLALTVAATVAFAEEGAGAGGNHAPRG